MRETRRWLNNTQPQTLQIAVMLLYLDAVLEAIFGGIFSPFGLLLIAAGVAAGFGIANEFKWGYLLGIGVAVFGLLPYVVYLANGGTILGAIHNPLDLMFRIAKLALLLHPQSRQYQRIWFK